jgi:hypothetical protein
MAQHPQLLNGSCQPELNELICRATRRIFPRFDALLRSMAAPDVDVRVIEARLEALVSACWALAAPFAVASPEHKSGLEELILQMDKHMAEMQVWSLVPFRRNFLVKDLLHVPSEKASNL